jgi:putative oxidoreductase
MKIDPKLVSYALGLLRIVSGYLLIQHGTAKLFGFPHVAYFDNLQVLSLIGVAGILEVIGGALLIVGLFTRPTAFVMSGLLAFAYFLGHASKGFFFLPMLNQGELAVTWCFLFLYFAAAGGGAFSLDGLRRKA